MNVANHNYGINSPLELGGLWKLIKNLGKCSEVIVQSMFQYLNFFQALCTKVHLIVLRKQLSTRDFLPCTKVFFRAGYEWLHGHSHFGCLLRKSENFLVPSHGNIKHNQRTNKKTECYFICQWNYIKIYENDFCDSTLVT